MKGMELYSWKSEGKGWCFRVVLGTNLLKSPEDITRADSPLVGVDDAKRELAKLARGEHVSWRNLAQEPVPGDMEKELVAFCGKTEVDLSTPSPWPPRGPAKSEPAATPKPLVQIALLLDTSNSMDGLIEQAKIQLWRIVNDFATARRDGQKPELQVALYHYGTPSLGAETGYIRQLVPLSGDLDKISEELFKLRTSGGDEYCGTVIQKAVNELKWSENKKDYKAIFIAGNEAFTQGKLDYKASCKAAITKGVVVNTIFCGALQEGIQTKWKDGADLADGTYINIDQNQKVAQIAAPQDKDLAELNVKLNATYIAYGRGGQEGLARQAAQDKALAAAAPAAAAERAAAKSSAFYRNESWDLVDAAKAKKADVATLKEEELPEELKKLPAEKRQAYVDEKAKERGDIQAQIAKVSKERDAYVTAERAKQAQSGTNTLDTAVINAVRSQAQKLDFQF
jgi:hypothetical protein